MARTIENKHLESMKLVGRDNEMAGKLFVTEPAFIHGADILLSSRKRARQVIAQLCNREDNLVPAGYTVQDAHTVLMEIAKGDPEFLEKLKDIPVLTSTIAPRASNNKTNLRRIKANGKLKGVSEHDFAQLQPYARVRESLSSSGGNTVISFNGSEVKVESHWQLSGSKLRVALRPSSDALIPIEQIDALASVVRGLEEGEIPFPLRKAIEPLVRDREPAQHQLSTAEQLADQYSKW